jgi:Tol biopolymer transport system component
MTCGNRLLLAACAALIGCTETIQLTRDPLAQLIALEITPGDAMIKLTDLAPPHHTLQYTAMGRFADGTTRDVTGLVEWTIDNGLLGSFESRGLFVASHGAAGYATTVIEASGLQATAALTVVIDATVIDSTFPPPAANLFDPANPSVIGDPLRSPKLVYPADGTVFPHNIARTLFQYQRGDVNDAFRITFDSDVLHLAVESGADRWQADGALQRLLAGSGIAGPIRSTIQATSSAAPGSIYVGNSVTLDFSNDAPGGQLYFWSAATSGIMRGGVDVATAGKLDPTATGCVGCHTVSRDGAEMAMGYDNTASTNLTTLDLGTLTPRISPSATRPMGWATYSPDRSRLLVANNGVLTLYESATGTSLGTVPLPPMRYATHPDWSPDGSYVAVALASQAPSNMDVRAASIARIPYNDGAWGAPQIIVAGSMTSNNYFPRWSPDGALLAYVRATGASQGATSADLMLVSSTGGTPRPLRLANHRVGTLDDVPALSNSMPTWAPLEGDRAWLAFVSARAYGAVLPTAGRGQIWVTSLDLTRAGDPSTPAFWLPCQDVTVLNNNPVWSKLEFTQ